MYEFFYIKCLGGGDAMFPSVSPIGEDPAMKNRAQRSFNEEERLKHANIYASRETHTFEYIRT
ncbi:hypothetical protein D3C78_1925520 [compost metagenome]